MFRCLLLICALSLSPGLLHAGEVAFNGVLPNGA